MVHTCVLLALSLCVLLCLSVLSFICHFIVCTFVRINVLIKYTLHSTSVVILQVIVLLHELPKILVLVQVPQVAPHTHLEFGLLESSLVASSPPCIWRNTYPRDVRNKTSSKVTLLMCWLHPGGRDRKWAVTYLDVRTSGNRWHVETAALTGSRCCHWPSSHQHRNLSDMSVCSWQVTRR